MVEIFAERAKQAVSEKLNLIVDIYQFYEHVMAISHHHDSAEQKTASNSSAKVLNEKSVHDWHNDERSQVTSIERKEINFEICLH